MVLAWVYRMPISTAWSTPGAALLVAAGIDDANFAAAVGAFILCGALIILTGLWPTLGRLITRIPTPLASAMLAGILLPICLAPVTAMIDVPGLAWPILLTWLVLFRLAPRWAVPAAMVVAGVVIALSSGSAWLQNASIAPQVTFVAPAFDPALMISLGVPLFIVTMAGQNVPGFVVMKAFGYETPARPVLIGTGLGTAAGAFFGGHAINLAAITAAIMASPEANPDKTKRWAASFTAGIGYLLLGLGAEIGRAHV